MFECIPTADLWVGFPLCLPERVSARSNHPSSACVPAGGAP